MDDAGEDTEPLTAKWEEEQASWENVKEDPFVTQKREYVVCADTMGQDREISLEDREYLEKFTKLLAQSWEQKERDLLYQDITRQLEYLESLQVTTPKDIYDQYNEAEERAAEEKAPQLEQLKENEKLYQYELDCAKLDKIKEYLADPKIQDYFINLKEYRVFKFPIVL